jgi:hypothetical protein
MNLQKSANLFLLIVICTFTVTVGCNRGTNPVTPTLAVATTEIPTSTATALPGKVIMVTGGMAEAAIAQQLQGVASELAASSGFIMDTRSELQPNDVTSDIRIVVLASAPANLNELLNAGTQTQFIVITDQAVAPAANLSVIQTHPEFRAFLAGYIAEAISVDWRAAGMLPTDTDGNIQEQAFLNGGRYFCGICQQAYTPLTPLPVAASLPAGSDTAAGQATATTLMNSRIYTMYVAPEVSTPDLLGFLAGQKVLTELGSMNSIILLGGEAPPENIRSIWAASIQIDYVTPLRAMWQSAMEGQSGQQVAVEILLTDVNETYLGVSKQRLVQDVLQKLQDGLLEPLTVP